jgi:arabinogalactan oligomer/maltooligosaccharide transport system permease protein
MINQQYASVEKRLVADDTAVTRKFHSQHRREVTINTLIYILLAVLGVLWILPIFGILYVSVQAQASQSGSLVPTEGFSLKWYLALLTQSRDDGVTMADIPFLKWFFNTLVVAVFVMLISTIFVLSVAYSMSRLRFKGRKGMMNVNLILGMFPGFLSMIVIYNLLKVIGIDGTLISLILIYSAASGSGFYIAKGFFDTVSKSLDEAARIDGANNFKVFYKIVLPLSKPIVVYTMLTSFQGPWVDYIFSSVILRDKRENYTVALGLYSMINSYQRLVSNYTMFFAGSVMISIPIMILFLMTQKYYVGGVTGGSVKG